MKGDKAVTNTFSWKPANNCYFPSTNQAYSIPTDAEVVEEYLDVWCTHYLAEIVKPM